MAKKLKKIKKENKSILDDNSNKKSISEKNIFPMPICLEYSKINKIKKEILKENAFEILNTLYSFSNEDLFNSKHPHILHKEDNLKKYFINNAKLISLDVKPRGNKNSTRGKLRLLYCKKDNICKITSLCTDDTH